MALQCDRDRYRSAGFLVAVVLLLVPVVLSCSDPVGPTFRREIATLTDNDDEPVVVAWDSVAVGRRFPITTRAFGNGCVYPGGERVKLHGNVVELTPMVRILTGDYNCPDYGKVIDQTAEVVFKARGVYEIRVFGKDQLGDTLITLHHEVVVR